MHEQADAYRRGFCKTFHCSGDPEPKFPEDKHSANALVLTIPKLSIRLDLLSAIGWDLFPRLSKPGYIGSLENDAILIPPLNMDPHMTSRIFPVHRHRIHSQFTVQLFIVLRVPSSVLLRESSHGGISRVKVNITDGRVHVATLFTLSDI
ncbi:hypothetical protein BS47DRAFT_1350885 [Hydnum rufescens UP504]|uniref:Uncharacterized protein n=1 Tax=Hydnum rufescens UP504 TaxID=1448309 RepID=A0A9P6ALE8_9AGAM|nr:hypothetical protein BS47DRAFT_1350885 [Hydnum rufescens UP504]